MRYRQLTLEERYQIEALYALSYSQVEIAKKLGRHPSTISREIARNSDPSLTQPYLARRAQRFVHRRQSERGENARKVQGPLQTLIEQKLRLSWSPEQISGRLRLELGVKTCHETIYQHVLRDTQKKGILRYCLRFGGYKHHRFKKSQRAERTRLRKNWLDTRPAAANQRTEIGHWERDCVLGQRGRAALLTIIDRKARYTRIRRIAKVNTEHVADATLTALPPYRALTKTITQDNGVEFQRDDAFQKRLGVPLYFTEPSSPWQRGSIENLNGLVRQYVRKGSDIGKLPNWAATAIENTLNFRPRKILGFKTPHEVFYGESMKLTRGKFLRLGLEFSALH
jgi:transposase, IS30 family